MGQLLVFRRREDAGHPVKRTQDAPADILFFTGVRYEREQPAPVPAEGAGLPEGTPPGAKRRKRRA